MSMAKIRKELEDYKTVLNINLKIMVWDIL